MRPRRARIGRAIVALAIVVLAGCSGNGAAGPGDSSSQPAPLTVFAAASLRAAIEAAQSAYEADPQGTALTIATDSSAALATQIEQGAPADVFLSADTTNARRLVDGGFADGEAVVFAANALTIITPSDNPAGLASPFDLARPGVRVIAAGDDVPITTYARQLIENLAADAGAPIGLAAGYAANVVSKEDNVAAVRSRIELGEGDAAIVYRTDAAASDGVATIEVPDPVNVRASYAGVVVQASPIRPAAGAFLDWLAGPAGQAILARFGFLPPPA